MARLRHAAFAAVTLGVGMAIVVVVEVALRAMPTLTPTPLAGVVAGTRADTTLYQLDPTYPQTLFFHERSNGRQLPAGMAAQRFLARGDNTLRVCVVGASTVQGFPHPRHQAAAAILQEMLADAMPERSVQVLNLGITSIASFAVARVVEDALKLQPDIVVVYAGHNEFYGVYARSGALQNQVRHELSQLSLAHLLRRGLDGFRGPRREATSLLQVMARKGLVEATDPLRQRAGAMLRDNLEDMARRCRRAQVPLVLCTLAANESGFAPAARPAAAESDAPAMRLSLNAAAETALSPAPDRARVLTAMQRLAAADADDPWVQYLRGRLLAQLEEPDAARAAFRLAREQDAMPWRAPRAFSQIIRTVAAGEAASLADVEADFDRAAPTEGVGWALMADHVHPTLAGQVRLARSMAVAVGTVVELPAPLSTDAAYLRRIADTPVGRMRVAQAMAELFARPPLDAFNASSASMYRRDAAQMWQALRPAERRAAEAWLQRTAPESLMLRVAEELVADAEPGAAADYFAAARREAIFTPQELPRAVQWARALTRAHGGMEGEQAQALHQTLARLAWIPVPANQAPQTEQLARELRALLD